VKIDFEHLSQVHSTNPSLVTDGGNTTYNNSVANQNSLGAAGPGYVAPNPSSARKSTTSIDLKGNTIPGAHA